MVHGAVAAQVKDYVLQLEALMAEVHRQAQRLIKRQSELGSSLGDLGGSLLSLGKFEQPPLADQFISIGEKSATLARTSQARLAVRSDCWALGYMGHCGAEFFVLAAGASGYAGGRL